ncbi:ATP-binding protein [Candidatus Palauibacter polyketidifaciens]|uniref:HAMP domain-containing sensor histidine kinase n=1 Tax=Candidatus Palauibacter polyketidifaciens TaxID=3056740 RepID=UPI002399F999|nr:ATP-binding protein [Candidatus Palauibacter polyketidifaciens]MDE2720106.1 ATP-binding protein [Candidatus Palauibacter polyketidifaciens]
MRLANRFFLAAGAVLFVAYIAAWFVFRLDTRGVVVESAVLGGILILLWPATRLAARRIEAEVDQARETVDRIASGDLDPSIGPTGSGPISSLNRAIDRMADRVRDRVAHSERESSDLRILFDELEDGLAFIDRDGLVSLCNAAFERWAGRAVSPGVRIGTLFRSPRIAQAVSAARQGESTTVEVELGEHTVLMSTRPHRSGAVIVLHDLTVMRRLEGVRRDFVANVSHELKTPLTSVVGFAEALSEGGLDSSHARDFARRILVNATRMRHLVEDLLDLSLLESGSWSPEPQPVSVGAVALEVWETLSPRVRGEEVTLDVSGPREPAYVDPDAIRQVLRNLLDNAARYSDDDPNIAVRIRSDGEFQRVEVTDRGPGIPSVHVERVFERFYRVDPARSRARGGTGLGLAIVKHFVEAHGGEVGIDSALGRGTTVWFTLPVAAQIPDEETFDVPA